MAIKKVTEKKNNRKVQTVRERANSSTVVLKKRRVLTHAATKVGFIISVITKTTRPLNKKPVRVVLRIIGLIVWPKFLRKSFAEVRFVVWPSASETRKLTSAVIVFSIIFGVIISITDYGLDILFKKIILN